MTHTIWDRETPLRLMDGVLREPKEIFALFPFTDPGAEETVVLTMTGNRAAAIDSLDMLRDVHNIPEDMDEVEALEEIHRIAITPEPEPEVSAEERIAAALEFQNLLNM